MQSNTLRIYRASLRSQFRETIRYRPSLFFNIANTALFTLVMLLYIPFYSSSVQAAVGTHNVLSYVLLGAIFAMFTEMMWQTRYILQDELDYGIIDYTFSSPMSRFGYFFALSMAAGTLEMIFNLPIFAIAVLAAISVVHAAGMILSLVSICLTLVITLFIGECLGAAVLVYRRIGGITGLIATASNFLSGAFVPLAIFPSTVQYIAFMFPQTAGLYLARYYLSGSALIIPVYAAWLIMIGEMLFFGFLAWLILRFAESVAKVEGFQHV
ncbi:MAG: ABC transporter permease [Candidatus Micrarchaeaceae archaeon]